MDEGRRRQQSKIPWRIGVFVLVVFTFAAAWNFNGSPAVDPVPSAARLDVANPADVYNPVRAGEPLPPGYRQLLARDQIAPIYDPVFANADDVDWPDDTLVIGVAGVESAKAYPVNHLNRREMVVDDIEGIPILVTW